MKFTLAKEITDDTRKAVLERQAFRSITGAYLTEETASFHHFIPRSASGVGYEWNIVALTFDEHRAIHDHQDIKVNGRKRFTWDEMQTLIRNHLILRYEGWSTDACKFRKYAEKEDYGVKRREKL